MRNRLTRTRNLLLLAFAALAAAPAGAAAAPGLIVVPHPAPDSALSYFSTSANAGANTPAGTLELRNTGQSALVVSLAAVNGRTLDTLGSGYETARSTPSGSTAWLRFGSPRVNLAPGAVVSVPVSVTVPHGAGGGEYLSGVSIEALGQNATSNPANGVSVASAERYAIGFVTSVPGPLHTLIHFTGAGIETQPSGIVFTVKAANDGNAIVKGVHGTVRVEREGKTIASEQIAPGTFVSHSAIAYPVPTHGQRPPEGTGYTVTATLVYPGGTAHLARNVTFGENQAHVQQIYGRSAGSSLFGSLPTWAVIGFALVAIYAAATTTVLLRRRRRETQPSA